MRQSALDELGSLESTPGSRSWALAVIGQLKLTLGKLDSDAKNAGDWLKLFEEHEGWKVLGYAGLSLFLSKELDLDEKFAERLKEAKPGQTIRQLRPWGDARDKERNEKGQFVESKGNNITSGRRGTSTKYTLARLHRDRPDLAKKVEAKELSANAAAIEAGFRKKPTPLDEMRRAWKKASKKERNTFLLEIENEMSKV